MTSMVSTAELKRAWRAVEAGHFRAPSSRRAEGRQVWEPEEPVIVVLGVTGRVGASTTAVALAEAADLPARVIECAPSAWSGLASATTAELGTTEAGWRQGSRGRVLIERPAGREQRPHLASPGAADVELTILDVSSRGIAPDDRSDWMSLAVETRPLLLVAVATVPGLLALDTHLRDDRAVRVWSAVIGPPLKKWPGQLRAACPPRVRSAVAEGRLTTIRHDPGLALTGLTASPTPRRVLADSATAIAPVLDNLGGTHDHRQ